jgi:hypothetical protein
MQASFNGQERALVALESLDANTPASIWKQFFVERSAEEHWTMLSNKWRLLLGRKAVVHISPQAEQGYADQIGAAIIRYLTCYNISIKELEIDRNTQLCVIPSQIGLLRSLTHLNLSHNFLDSLPSEIGGLVHLKRLNLSNNILALLPPSIGSLRSLEYLDASKNCLEALPSELRFLLRLKHCNLSYNNFRPLPYSLYGKIFFLRSESFCLDNNPCLEGKRLVPTSREVVQSYAYQVLPRSLRTLCMYYIEKKINLFDQEDLENNLPEELCQAARKKCIEKECTFEMGKNIINLVRINQSTTFPFYIDTIICVPYNVRNMYGSLKRAKLYLSAEQSGGELEENNTRLPI